MDEKATSILKRLESLAPVQFVSETRGSHIINRNSPEQVLECSNSDIVVKGTLLLRKLKVNAAEGCRLDVTGTVFIEEEITYAGTGERQNLQITSASAVVMGVGLDRLKDRLINRKFDLELIREPMILWLSRFWQRR